MALSLQVVFSVHGLGVEAEARPGTNTAITSNERMINVVLFILVSLLLLTDPIFLFFNLWYYRQHASTSTPF